MAAGTRFLVLGGAGFIGSHVVEHLAALGHEVRVVSRRDRTMLFGVPGVDYVQGDWRDPATITSALADVGCVIHADSATTPGTADADPAFDVTANLLPVPALLDALAVTGVRRLVYLSSGGMIYGPAETLPIVEDHPLRPLGSYGIVKMAAEAHIAAAARNRGLCPVILRPSNTYGERQGRDGTQGLVNMLLGKALGGGLVEIWGDGTMVRDHLHVHDLARLCVMSALGGATGVFNAGTGVGTSVRELIARVSEVTGRELRVRYGPERSIDVPASILDVSRARDAFGWTPRIALREGLERTWAWHQAGRKTP
jgi:UDP-glucose 4-epimerase